MSDHRLEVVLAAQDLTGAAFTKVQNRAVNLSKKIFSLQGAMTAMAGAAGIGAVTSGFLDAATTVEGYRTRLSVLLGSVEKGSQLFDEMANYAGRVPFEYEKVMQSATQLAGVMKGGTEEIKQWMPLIGDLAATSGLSIETATEQIARMYSSGAASADMFRERGILSMLGFEAGVSYSAEETRKRLMDAWEDPTSQFAGATEKMADDWSGMTSMLADKWFMFRNDVMDAGIFDLMKGEFGDLLSEIDRLKEDGTLKDWAQEAADYTKRAAETIGDVAEAVKPIVTTGFDSFKNIWGWYSGLPVGVQTLGILGYMLAGPGGAAAIVALGAVVKDVSDDVLLAQEGLLDVDGSLNLYTKHYNDWLKAHNLGTAATREQIAATIRAEAELKKYAQTSQDMADIYSEITEETKKQTKAVEENAEGHIEAIKLVENGYGNMFDGVTWGMGQMEDAWGTATGNIAVAAAATLGPGGSVVKETEAGTDVMGGLWDDFGQSLEGTLAGAFQHEFDGIGGFFENLLDDMYSMFTSWAAKIAAQQIVFSMSDSASGANTLATLFSGGGSAGANGSGDFSSMMNFAGLVSKAKTGYEYVTGGELLSQFYQPAHILPAGVAGPTTAGGLTSSGYMGVIGAAVAAQTQISKWNQSQGYNEVWINGQKVTLGDAWTGDYFADPTAVAVSGIMGTGPTATQYADAFFQEGDYLQGLNALMLGLGDMSLGPLGLNPGAWLGEALFGWGGHSEPHMSANLGLAYGADGLTTFGTTKTAREYTGEFVAAVLNGKGNVNDAALAIDEAIGDYLDIFADSINTLGDVLPGEIGTQFDTVMAGLLGGYEFDSSYHGTHLQEWAENVMARLDQELGDLVSPTIAAFSDLSSAILEVTPAFGELLTSLNSASAAYFDPLLSIDQMIADANGPSGFYGADLAAQTGVYQTLFDNAVANGLDYDIIARFGLDFASSLTALQDFAGIDPHNMRGDLGGITRINDQYDSLVQVDLSTTLQGIRDAMLEAGGSPAEFQAAVQETMVNFVADVNKGINAIATALTNIHPNIDLDVNVDMAVVQSATATATANGGVVNRFFT